DQQARMIEQRLTHRLGRGADIDKQRRVIGDEGCSSLADGILGCGSDALARFIFEIFHPGRQRGPAMHAGQQASVAKLVEILADGLHRNREMTRQRIDHHPVLGAGQRQNGLLPFTRLAHGLLSFCAILGSNESRGKRQTSSSSISVPSKSLGCRNSTGLPWAPVLGVPSPSTRAPPAVSVAAAAMMSGTSKQMWCMPPAGFLARNVAIGEASPSGSSSSTLVLPVSMKTTVTPCSGRAWGCPTRAPSRSRYLPAAAARSGTAMAMWLRRPIIGWRAFPRSR